MEILERIKMLGNDRSMSIAEIERKLGFGSNTIYRWKTSIPGADKVVKLADYFGVTTDYLIGLETYEEMRMKLIRRSRDNKLKN